MTLDLAPLEDWIRANVLPDWAGVDATATRTSAGFSYETWILDVSERSGSRHCRLVLRREPRVGPIEPYDIAAEVRILEALEATGVLTPRLLAHCSDPSVFGQPFIVVEFIDGDVPDYRTVPSSPDWQNPVTRGAMAREFVATLAGIQAVDVATFAGRTGLSRPAGERERICASLDHFIGVIEQRRPQSWPPHPIFEHTAAWLRRNAPDAPAAEMVLVHGDYKLGNLIWQGTSVVAVLDWEGAQVGDPLQDLGYACHPIMREAQPELMAMLAPLDELVSAYEQATGRTVDLHRLHYYVIYALFFHTFTVVMGLVSVVEPHGDIRIAGMYSKLNQVTRHIADEIDAYERGAGVL
jgi:aminoglycoside phosphotransferase (APT) family kinase protein